MLNVVLDTSGSMTDEIPRALGAIADFCDAVGVDQVRLVQCDAAVTADERCRHPRLAEHEVTGYGGSDCRRRCAIWPTIRRYARAAVVTDGDIAYPPGPMPYDVLWVLPPRARGCASAPPYGRVVRCSLMEAR